MHFATKNPQLRVAHTLPGPFLHGLMSNVYSARMHCTRGGSAERRLAVQPSGQMYSEAAKMMSRRIVSRLAPNLAASSFSPTTAAAASSCCISSSRRRVALRARGSRGAEEAQAGRAGCGPARCGPAKDACCLQPNTKW